jgi:hypothetical protein
MLAEELESFSELHQNYLNLENSYYETAKRQADLRKELQEVLQSKKSVFGFFITVTREDKIKDIRGRLAKCDADLSIYIKLISLISFVITKIEIPLIKVRKELRANEIIQEFSRARLRKLKNERYFWDNFLRNDTESEYKSEDAIIDFIDLQLPIKDPTKETPHNPEN